MSDDTRVYVEISGRREMDEAKAREVFDLAAEPLSAKGLVEMSLDMDTDELIGMTTLTITVDRPNPAYRGDDVLFGSPPPKRIIESAAVNW